MNDLILELLIGFKTDLIRNYKCGKPQTSWSTFKRLAVQHQPLLLENACTGLLAVSRYFTTFC